MPDPLAYRRTHSLLLVQRLLSFRPGVSPLTVILDSLEQSARPLMHECLARAKSNKIRTVFLAFETLQAPPDADIVLHGRGKGLSALPQAVHAALGATDRAASAPAPAALLVIDTTHPLLDLAAPLPSILAALAPHPNVSLLLTYHTDAPLPAVQPADPYAPPAPALLAHLATTLLHPTSLPHAYAAHSAALRSLPPPAHGLDASAADGELVGLGANGGGPGLPDAPPGMARGLVVDVEHRRRSGRGVTERVVLLRHGAAGAAGAPSKLMLLDEHPCFRPSSSVAQTSAEAETPEAAAGTFSLTLTERQRAERAGVVLPYYDAQREGSEGVAEGGRILYQMGIEDAGDWDSEEDEL